MSSFRKDEISEREDTEALYRKIETLEHERACLLGEVEKLRSSSQRVPGVTAVLLSALSHDARTPLSSIIGFTEIIREGMAGPITKEQKEYLGDVYHSAQHLLQLIDELYNLLDEKPGNTDLNLREVTTGLFINSCLLLFRQKAVNHNISLDVEVGKNCERIFADEKKLKHVVINLIAGAFNSTSDDGKIMIRVERPDTRENALVTISTSDRILPTAEQKGIFPLMANDGIDDTAGTRFGLGLCKEYVELHGGFLKIEPQPRGGMIYSFSIPFISGPDIGNRGEAAASSLVPKRAGDKNEDPRG